ncbi:MAG: D-alanine--D-alanine ligase [Oscillospiraceae bacterium]|nr:D-alanine--D-alanine ligase [Oscillospiraceae bacterium]
MDIVVLCGGMSAERDVSIASGTAAAAALRRCGNNVSLIDMFFGNKIEELSVGVSENAPNLENLRKQKSGSSRIGDNVPEICKACDIVFIALHGEDGEDGKIQSMLDLIGVKYTGTGVLGSAIAMDKDITKQLFLQNGINTPQRYAAEAAKFPCVVKPNASGSSVGVSIVMDAREYPAALAEAAKYGEVIVEQYIPGREFTVGVIAGKALPVGEIRPKTGFFDYKNKYQDGLTDEIFPAEISAELTTKLQREAERVFKVLKFEVYGRMDFIVDESGETWCIEGNTLPGITPMSLIPKAAAAAGMSYDDFCEAIVHESLKKYGEIS